VCCDNNDIYVKLKNKYNLILSNIYKNNIEYQNPEYVVNATFHLSRKLEVLLETLKKILIHIYFIILSYFSSHINNVNYSR